MANGNTRHRPTDDEGRPHGTEKQYYPDGKLAAEIVYNHGAVLRINAWWPSGRLWMESYEGDNYEMITKGYLDQP